MNKIATVSSLVAACFLFSPALFAQGNGDSLATGWTAAMYITNHNDPYGHNWSAADEVYAGYDFDGDGNLEFYYITDESNPNSSTPGGPILEYDDGAFVYLYEYNPSTGDFEKVWTWADTAFSNGSASFPASTVGDLDGDGNLELLLAIPTNVSTGNPTRFWVFESEVGVGLPSTATATWNFDASPDGNIRPAAMAAGDIDGDGAQEVAVAFRKFSDVSSNDARMIFSLSGGFLGPFTQWNIEDFDSSDMGSVYAAAITDVDNDGNLEAYFATDYITLYEASGTDTYVRSDNVDAGSDHWNLTNSAIGYDADGDGDEELLYATWGSTSASFRMVYGATDAQNIDTTDIYNVFEFGGGCRAFTAGDFDADGLTDVFFAQNYGPVWRGEYSGSGDVTDGTNWDFAIVWKDTVPLGDVRPYTVSFPGDARNIQQTGNTLTDMDGDGHPELLIAIEDGDTTQAWIVMLESDDIVGIKLDGSPVLKSYRLKQNYPNPFNAATNIEYYLPAYDKVTLTIYNLLGQKVRTLVDGQQAAGSHSVMWDGTNEAGQIVSSGVYTYEFRSGGLVLHQKMTLLK